MMGRSHAIVGVTIGLAAARIVGADFGQAIVFAFVVGAWSLAPDLDHPSARMSRFWCWCRRPTPRHRHRHRVSRCRDTDTATPSVATLFCVGCRVSATLRSVSRHLYDTTRTPLDPVSRDPHRTWTHSWSFGVATGGVATLATSVGGPWVSLTLIVVSVLLLADTLGDWVVSVSLLGVAAWVAVTPAPAVVTLASLSGWLGVAVWLGCWAHCLGDAPTESAIPFLAPFKIRGQRWYRLRFPDGLRFRVDSPVERVIVAGFVVVAALLVPGVPGLVVAGVAAVAG